MNQRYGLGPAIARQIPAEQGKKNPCFLNFEENTTEMCKNHQKPRPVLLYSDEIPETALFNAVFLVKYWLNNG